MVYDELIIRSLRGETLPSEEQKLKQWRLASLENERRVQQLSRLWQLRDLVAPSTDVPAPTAREIIAGSSGTRRSAGLSGRLERRVVRRPLWAAAALVAGLVGVAYLFNDDAGPGEPVVEPPTPIDLATDAQEQSTVHLGDGTVVRLAGRSRLRVEGTEAVREAWLDGRAFFAVAHQSERPFVVRTEWGELEVKGTRFDVESRDGRLRVAVLDGLVDLTVDGRTVSVRPGDVGEILQDGQIRVGAAKDMYGIVRWMGDFIAFESTPLAVVVEEMERRYDLEIHVRDQAIADRTVTVWSLDRDPREVLEVICRAVQAVCTEENGVMTMW